MSTYRQNCSDKWIEFPGQFHTVLCVLRCLGQTVESSGLDQAWVESDIYSNVTVLQIINDNNHNWATECHLVTVQVLCDLCYMMLLYLHDSLAEACRNGEDTNEAHEKRLDTMNTA